MNVGFSTNFTGNPTYQELSVTAESLHGRDSVTVGTDTRNAQN